MRRSSLVLAALIVGGIAVTIGIVVAVEASTQTRECTIESVTDVRVRRALDYTRVGTVECGDIHASMRVRMDVINPDCPYDIAKVGGRYLMTTKGYDFWPIEQRLVGSMVLVEPAPGAVCRSDAWLDSP